MAQKGKTTVRMPALKFAHLQKKFYLNRYRARPIKKKQG